MTSYITRAQIEQEIIYERGKACKVDDDCFTYPGSICLPNEGLCLAQHYTRGDNAIRRNSPWLDISSDKRSNWMCPENDQSIMTDAIRRAALEQHNFYRLIIHFKKTWIGHCNVSCTSRQIFVLLNFSHSLFVLSFLPISHLTLLNMQI